MLYVVFFTDNTDHADARKRLMPAHLSFLEQHQDHIRAAGPLHEVTDDSGAGGLWLVEAESPDAVARALVLQAHAASIQDRDGAVPLLKASRKAFPFIERELARSL